MHDDSDREARGDASDRELGADGPTLIEAAPEQGFNYPYYLAVPEGVGHGRRREGASPDGDDQRPILVEPHNVGGLVDEVDRHLALAKQRIETQSGRYVANELGAPMLVPVFPRPRKEPVDWTHMIHMLCARTMRIEAGPLERVDRQLLAMIDDARERLAAQGIAVPEAVMLTGFSAAAAFVNRFAALHPARVHSVSAGGINGLAILPQQTAELGDFGERPMNYPVGVANVEALTGEPFDREAFRDLDQFIYMGSEDDKDALLWPDAWTDPELRGVAVFTYGEDIHDERFPHCRTAYEAAGVNAVFRMYDGVGHTPEPALDDIVAFHERSLAEDGIGSMREALGGGV